MPRRIPVEHVKPGQILAEELARHDGVLLASRGSEVTEGLIRMLHRQNIDTIVIEEEEGRTREEIEAEYGASLSRMDEAFRRVEGEGVLAALKKTLIFLAQQERDKSLKVLELSELSDQAPDGAEGGDGPKAGAEKPSEGPGGRAKGSRQDKADSKADAKADAKAGGGPGGSSKPGSRRGKDR